MNKKDYECPFCGSKLTDINAIGDCDAFTLIGTNSKTRVANPLIQLVVYPKDVQNVDLFFYRTIAIHNKSRIRC